MKRAIIAVLILFSGVAIAEVPDKTDVPYPVEYVRICSLYGAGFYYIPGTDSCILPTTGEIRRATNTGVQVSESMIAYRISQLERKLAMLEEKLNRMVENS